MSWIDIAWPMMGAASLTLALVYFAVWLSRPGERAYLMLSLAAVSVSALAILELLGMRATDATQYGDLLRWAHFFVAVLVSALVGYVRLRFHAGSLWLAYAAVGLRWLAFVTNFSYGENLNFWSIRALTHVEFLGNSHLAVPLGVANPWNLVGQASSLLVLAFLLHAIDEVWRRGDPAERRRAVIICGGIAVSYLFAVTLVLLVTLGLVRAPLTVNVPALVMVAIGAYDLGFQLMRSAQLTRALEGSQGRLRESELRFHQVFDASPTAMLMVDAAGRIVLANSQADSVFGYESQELIGMDVEALLPGQFPSAHGVELHPGSQPRSHGELHGLRRDGSKVPVVAGFRPIVTPEGTFVLASVADISDRITLEREAALQREELVHLSRVNVMGELSGSMAHELNQPLSAILSNAQAAQQLLARDPADLDEVKAALADIVADDKRASAVIRRLRAMLKKQAVDHRPLDLNRLVVDVLRLARSDLLNRNATARVELAPDLPRVQGDQVQLQQVLINLLLNAGDAMLECEEPHEMVIRSRPTSDGWAEIAFSDNGQGITPSEMERIFDPFVTTKRDGIGLGLAVCRTIILAHGGYLWAENNPGRGATLYFQLPPLATTVSDPQSHREEKPRSADSLER